MKIKTIKGALFLSERIVKKTYGENFVGKKIIDKESGIIATEFSLFLVIYIEKIEKERYELFPTLFNQLFWDEGIKIKKRTLVQFMQMNNSNNKKLSVLFVAPNGTILQASPQSIENFCKATNLIFGKREVYYLIPTIVLTRLNGNPSNREIITKKKLSLISQIIEPENEEDNNLFDLSFNLEEFDTDIVNEFLQLLKSINNHLSNIEKELYRRKK